MFVYSREDERFCIVGMKTDISECKEFKDNLEKGRYYDMETPYGYGGPLCDRPISSSARNGFKIEMEDYCHSLGIVSLFVRFHPLLNNYKELADVLETRYMHDTIYMSTDSPGQIMSNMDSKNRNMVRKAIKSGVTVECHEISDYKLFKSIYEETMDKDNADKYFYFSDEYYRSCADMKENTHIFVAMMEGEPIAGTIVYFNDRFAHYHLAGTRTEYRKFAPSNLMLYEIACWASRQGIKSFHLGGGMKQDDNLFGFKKQFNKNGRIPFYVGRMIFDKAVYKELLDIRHCIDTNFDQNNNRMIQYRA